MSHFNLIKLKDLNCSFLSGFAFKSKDYIDDGIPIIKIGNIQRRTVSCELSTSFYPDSLVSGKIPNYLLSNKDVLIAMTGQGSVGRVGKMILQSGHKALMNQRVGKFLCDEISLNREYLYYILTTDLYQDYLWSAGTGSGQPNLSPEVILETEVPAPNYSEQKAIASVLSSLDDKINLLNRQNKTLESMAETLFRQWFIEEVEDDWKEVVITELFEIRDGTHDSPKQKPIGKYLITSRHIGEHKLDLKNAYLISDEDYEQVNKRSKVDTNDILFSMIGTLGLTYFEQSETINYAIKNIGLFKTSQNPEWKYYTFLWLNSHLGKEFIHLYRSGSTQEYIALKSLRSIVFDAPPMEVLLKFNDIASGYFDKIKNNMVQIQTLEKLRDTLLPKLMSGEVRVSYEQDN